MEFSWCHQLEQSDIFPVYQSRKGLERVGGSVPPNWREWHNFLHCESLPLLTFLETFPSKTMEHKQSLECHAPISTCQSDWNRNSGRKMLLLFRNLYSILEKKNIVPPIPVFHEIHPTRQDWLCDVYKICVSSLNIITNSLQNAKLMEF